MKTTDINDIKIGQWWTICCHLDLEEIKTDKDLEDVKEMAHNAWIEEDFPKIDIWETQLEALLEIRKGWRDPKVIAEIDELIAGICWTPPQETFDLVSFDKDGFTLTI